MSTPDDTSPAFLAHVAPTPRRRPLGIALQALGFLTGIGLMVWVVVAALSRMTPDRWAQLRAAEWWQIALLVALASASVVLNGLLWWLAIRPVRPPTQGPRALSTVAVNAVATTLAYLPFKLSLVFRVWYHRAFDRVPILQFGGWAAAFSAALLAALGPGVAAALTPLRGNTPLWLATALAGAIAAAIVGSALSRFFATGPGWRWLRRTAFRLAGHAGLRLVRSSAFQNLHAGVHMLADPRDVLAAVALRLLDTASLAARFALAGHVLGAPIAWGDAAIVAVSYFLIGALSPAGTVGVREGGTAGVLLALGLDPDALLPVILLVAASQLLGDLLAAGLAVAHIGPRILTARAASPPT